MKESKFQKEVKQDLQRRFPGCIITKTDANQIQGFPDLLMLWGKHWAALECKREKKAHRQPNQEFYVDILNQMSFAAFIEPNNKNEVLNAMEQAFQS